ncbi:hypothetical protein [Flavobacterium caeni]|nr:hypothetical protein [Flavobacterium caeni]
MKIFKSLLLLPVAAMVFVGCQDDDERYNGSPVGKNNLVTLTGQLSTNVTSALTDQKIEFTVTLPRTFSDTVAVQATAISDSGRRIRGSVDVMPGETTATGDIFAPGGSIFDTTFDMYLSGIALQTPDPVGTHYFLTSDVLKIATGNSAIPVQNSERLIIRLVWPDATSTTNTLAMTVDRPTAADGNAPFQNGGREHRINVGSTGNNTGGALSTEAGDYLFKIKATALLQQPIDMPYRLIIVYPDGEADVFSGVYNGLTTTSPEITIAKINKSYVGNETVFTSENLIP